MITIINYWIKMKNILKTLPLALIVMSIYSCTSDDETVQDVNDNSSVVTTFTCMQENEGTATKAAMGPEGKTILWKSEDAISIFDGDGNKQFTLNAESDGQKSGSFTGKCYESESYVAVYPYTEGATLSDDRKSVSNIVLPDEQNAVAGGFDPKAALMIAKSNTTTLQFKNAVGFIKVTPQFDCKKIILRAADKTQPLAGKGTIKFDGSDPYIDFTDSKELSYSITLSGTITSGNAYYIAVPAVTLSANWTLTFVTENKNYMRQVTKPITFARSKAWNLGTFATDGDYWVGSNGIVSTDKQVDWGLTIEQCGKTYKVYFAKSNLTATGLAANESDYGDYFAWAATEPWYSSATRTWKEGKSERGYTAVNTPFLEGTSYTKYTTHEKNLEASDDAANVILGGDWQIPTQAIWQALVNNLSSKGWDDVRKGYTFTNNGQTLFLPAAGYINGTLFDAVGSDGYYWSGTAFWSPNAYYLLFNSSDVGAQQVWDRYSGYSVRPVRLVEVSAATNTEGYNVENDFEW